ncbi:MAG: glycosyltransferase family 39 protein [Candidatus Latescibacterota bacterium]
MSARLVRAARRVPQPWFVLAVALGVRLAYVSVEHSVPPQDTPDYDEIALNLLRGEGFVARGAWHGHELHSWRPPFYPCFLALVYGSLGYSHGAVRVVQACVGAGTALLVWDLGRRLMPAAALTAGLLAALYGPLVSSSYEVMSETWFTFLGVLSLSRLARATRGQDPGRDRLLLGGCAVGLAALTRPVGLLLLPAFALPAVLAGGRQGIRRTAWVAVGLACVMAPWTLRNWRVHGAIVPLTTQGGFIVARANAAVPDWRVPDGWGIAREVFERVPCEVERDRLWMRQGLQYIGSHPGHYLRLAGERFLRFWYFLRPDYNAWFVAVLPFFLGGLWLYGRQDGFVLLGAYTGISVLVFAFVLYGSTRFRLPLEPLFLLFAAAGAHGAAARWGGRKVLAIAAAVALANGALAWQEEALRQAVLRLLAAWGLK